MSIKKVTLSIFLASLIGGLCIQIHKTPVESCFTNKLSKVTTYQAKFHFFLDKIIRTITPDFMTQIHMSNNFQARPCKNKELIDSFNAVQDELEIYPHIPLYVATNPPQNHAQDSPAFYSFSDKTVTIIEASFKKQPMVYQKHILYHELKHHIQNITPENIRFNIQTKKLIDEQKLTQKQALEHDADSFGAIKSTKLCATCLKNLKKYLPKEKPTQYLGYLTQEDFDQATQHAEQSCFCNQHNSRLKRSVDGVKNLLF